MRPNAEHAITAAGGRAADDDAFRGAQTSSRDPLSPSSLKVSGLPEENDPPFLLSQILPRPNFREIAIAGGERLYEQLVWSP